MKVESDKRSNQFNMIENQVEPKIKTKKNTSLKVSRIRN